MRDRDQWYAFWSMDDEPEDWKEEFSDEARREKERFMMQWCFKGDERRIMGVVGHLLEARSSARSARSSRPAPRAARG